jgi:acyl-CoA thioester hydrolase
VVDISLRYLRPARYDDTVVITTLLKEKPTLRIRMDYELHRGDDLIATASSLHVFIDRAGKPVRPPAAFASLMQRIFA